MEKELSVWSLIQNDEFEKACDKADKEFRNVGDITALRNKTYALFHLKEYNKAISLSRQLIEIRNGETESDFEFLGIANWIVGNIDIAIDAWQRAQDSLYKDAAGGIGVQLLLYFAAIKTGQNQLKLDALKIIKKLLKSKRSTNWPGPIGHYLLEEITESELFSFIVNVPILKERQLCQAHFAVAAKTLEKGDNEEYYQKLKDCISYGPRSYLEQTYYLAKGELEKSNEQ